VFCTRCGSPLPEDARFCPRCGNPVGNGTPSAPAASSAAALPTALTLAPHLVLVWDKLALHAGFQIQDPSGTTLGATQGGLFGLSLSNELKVLDSAQQVVLVLRTGKVAPPGEHGLHLGITMSDAAGAEICTVRPMTTFGPLRFEVWIGAAPSMVLVLPGMQLHDRLEEAGSGRLLASSDRQMALRTSRTVVEISETPGLDHRIVIGAMLLATYLSLRNTR